jgi:hydroxypyruvate isomerase
MGEDVPASFTRMTDEICVLQLADQPGRVEPGAGGLDIIAVLAQAIVNKFSGLVELEHGWSGAGAAGERAGLERVIAVDKAAAALAERQRRPS